MLSAILAMTGLAATFGLLLGYASLRFRVEGDPITDQIEALLPMAACTCAGYFRSEAGVRLGRERYRRHKRRRPGFYDDVC